MQRLYKDYLFSKHILVNEGISDENAFETLFSIANMFNIKVVSGQSLAERGMIEYLSEMLGVNVPEPFYRGFPDSVRKLSGDELLFDQIVHYTVTYGFGNFSEAGHSIMEEYFDRCAFKEKTEIKEFVILTENEAVEKIKETALDLLKASRPLNATQYSILLNSIKDFDIKAEKCSSKNTALRLTADLENTDFARFLMLSDVIKLVEEINYRSYANENIHKLNLRNRHRKLITSVIDYMFRKGKCDKTVCYERKAEWCGLLHHIHYRPVNEEAKDFTDSMRNKGNGSVYSVFEKEMKAENVQAAADVIRKGKGAGALLRNLDYLASRCKNDNELEKVINSIETENKLILIQLLIKYSVAPAKYRRTFKFTKYEKLNVHTETETEAKKRKTFITERQSKLLYNVIKKNLESVLKNKLGKVFIDPEMKNYALPIQETTSQSGLGVLAKASRIRLGEFEKLRAFTYWELVDDIDLSCFGLTKNGEQIEFSWRTMADRQCDAIVYSGDQTSGYEGGSEYFDIIPETFKAEYPEVSYIVFCNNVFSRLTFKNCLCTAGYMIRDIEDSGKVFEPKTVKTSFKINADSTFAYLYAIDLDRNDIIWLNMTRNSYAAVAGTSDMSFLIDYFNQTDVINVYSFFEMMAAEIVDRPDKAELIVSDKITDGENIIHSYDFEKLLAFMG